MPSAAGSSTTNPPPPAGTGLFASLTGLSGIGELVIRGLELLGGFALMALGLLLVIFTLAPGVEVGAEDLVGLLGKVPFLSVLAL